MAQFNRIHSTACLIHQPFIVLHRLWCIATAQRRNDRIRNPRLRMYPPLRLGCSQRALLTLMQLVRCDRPAQVAAQQCLQPSVAFGLLDCTVDRAKPAHLVGMQPQTDWVALIGQ